MAVHGTPFSSVADTALQCDEYAKRTDRYVCQQPDGRRRRADTVQVTAQYLFSEPLQGSHRENIMRNTFTRKEFALAVAYALALGALSATASA
jgi:hypothetical protein